MITTLFICHFFAQLGTLIRGYNQPSIVDYMLSFASSPQKHFHYRQSTAGVQQQDKRYEARQTLLNMIWSNTLLIAIQVGSFLETYLKNSTRSSRLFSQKRTGRKKEKRVWKNSTFNGYVAQNPESLSFFSKGRIQLKKELFFPLRYLSLPPLQILSWCFFVDKQEAFLLQLS